jgi:hypothetical protein
MYSMLLFTSESSLMKRLALSSQSKGKGECSRLGSAYSIKIISGLGRDAEGAIRYKRASRPFDTAVTGKPSFRIVFNAIV